MFQDLRNAYRRNALLAVPLLATAWLLLACQSCLAAVAGDGAEGAATAEHHCCPHAVQSSLHDDGCECLGECLAALPDGVQPPVLAKSVDEKPAPALVALADFTVSGYPVVWQIPPPVSRLLPGDPLLLARKCALLL